jgi:4-hydroxy-tetrahydrodipicolinate synthase
MNIDNIKGSIPPVITPFRGNDVDYDAYAVLIERQVTQGSHGVLVNGTTAEPSTLTLEERNRLVDIAIEVVKKRVPVVAATGSQSLADTLVLSEHASKAGADALLVVTPYYIRPPQRGLVAYYNEVCSRTDLPVMIYHIPGRTAISVTLETVASIRDKSANMIGIKHAVNDLGFCSDLLKEFGDGFRIFVGLEELSFPMMAIGACGLMNAVSNLMPGPVAEMCERVFANDLAGAKKIHYDLFELNKSVFFDTNPIAIKYMMKRMGIIPDNSHRLPMMPATPELEKRLDKVLADAGLI